MKRINIIFLTGLLLCLPLTGCGSQASEAKEDAVTTQETVEAETEEILEEVPEEIIEEGPTEEELAIEKVNQGIELIYSDREEALRLFEEAADAGNDDAKFLAGYMLDWVGNGNYEDCIKAREYYEMVSDTNPYANFCLSLFYKYAQGVVQDIDKAEELFAKAVDVSDENYADNTACPMVAYYLTGQYFGSIADEEENEEAKAESYKKCKEYCEKASELGDLKGMVQVGLCYENGLGVDVDYEKAMEWFEKSAELNYTDAMNYIAYMYRDALGVEQDHEKQLEWLEKSASLGNSNAMNQIGLMYEHGNGVEEDHAKAMEWFKKAEALGQTGAINNMGWMYLNAIGVEQDTEKALEMFTKAADLGDKSGMNNIGYVYWTAKGVEQDNAKAMEWFEKAAALGNTSSMYNIAQMYWNGDGVDIDKAKAKEWLEKSADLGHEKAKDALKQIGN